MLTVSSILHFCMPGVPEVEAECYYFGILERYLRRKLADHDCTMSAWRGCCLFYMANLYGERWSPTNPTSSSGPRGVEEDKARRYCLWQEWALGALDGKLRDNPC